MSNVENADTEEKMYPFENNKVTSEKTGVNRIMDLIDMKVLLFLLLIWGLFSCDQNLEHDYQPKKPENINERSQ